MSDGDTSLVSTTIKLGGLLHEAAAVGKGIMAERKTYKFSWAYHIEHFGVK